MSGSTWLRPAHLGRQRHQNRFDIAARHQSKSGAAVVDEIEFGIASAPDKLLVALILGPILVHARAHDLREDRKHRKTHVARKGEVLFPIVLEIIVEDAAYAPRLVAVLDEEVFVAPFREAVVVIGAMRVAGALQLRMKAYRIGMVAPALLTQHRCEIRPAA